MITVQPTCRFCHRKLVDANQERVGEWIVFNYICQPCKSKQIFDANGRDVGYSFAVGDYCLYFWPPSHRFDIMEIKGDNFESPTKSVLKLNYCPTNLTPSNTTVDKIKTLILFS